MQMFRAFRDSLHWLPGYLLNATNNAAGKPQHLFFCICDHFEPYNNSADAATARKRIGFWMDQYPGIAEKLLDSDGRWLRYSFFYPEEEYSEADLNMLASLCRDGYGEVEVHLHHDNDTSENLRQTLLDFKNKLHDRHGLLSIDKLSGEISYGFIHGNWALCNSRRDGRWCGINDEISVLLETGCYADFTLPAAPSETQTRTINSIYYVNDVPGRTRSHDSGIAARVGATGEGLLMVQGPLGLNWKRKKLGLIPKLENGGLYSRHPVTRDRIDSWIREGVQVNGAPESIFIKLYNHGAFEEMIESFLLKGGLINLLSGLKETCEEKNLQLHFVTAREMVNVIHSLETGYDANDAANYNRKYQIT